MSFISLFILAVGLSMDAFAVSVCKGLAMRKIRVSNAFIVGLWFGGFQMLMPVIGYFLGSYFQRYIEAVDHWIAFILLAIIGINMIRESREEEEESASASLAVKDMFPLAVATSIDALAAGISLACLQVNIWTAVSFIGITTCILSMIGVKVGSVFGTRYKSGAELAGGLILILLGFRILLEHLGLF